MYNRYQGNTGRVQRVEERHGHEERRPSPPARPHHPAPAPAPPRQSGLMEQLGRLLPGMGQELETEDLILLLILYLMYRESGDSELLMIMGAMFLL